MRPFVFVLVAALVSCANGEEESSNWSSYQSAVPQLPTKGGSVAWGRRVGSESFQSGPWSRIQVEIDRQGNVVWAGGFRGSAIFGGRCFDAADRKHAFISKLDRNGNHLWSKHLRSDGEVVFGDMTVDRWGNVITAGLYSGTLDLGGGPLTDPSHALFLAKFDENGQHVWSKSYGGDNVMQWVGAVATDHRGRILLTAALEGTLDFGGLTVHHTGPRPYVLQLTADAQPKWVRIIEGSVDQELNSIAADTPGNVYVAGTAKRTTIDGKTYQSGGWANILVIKFRDDGDTDWVRFVGDKRDQWLSSMSLDQSGNVLISGIFDGVADFGNVRLESENTSAYVVKLDKHGRSRWGQLVSAFQASSVVADNAGNAWLAGSFGAWLPGALGGDLQPGSLENAGGSDAFVAQFSKPKGDFMFGESWGDEQDQYATDIAVGRQGEVVVAGRFNGSMRIGDDELTGEGDSDLFVARVR